MTSTTAAKPKKPQRLTSVLSLVLEGSRLEGVVLRRTNGSIQQQQVLAATLSLDPLTAAPELVGREIRNQLNTAGIKERYCVLGLPLKWVLTAHSDVPDLADEDIPGFLEIEGERLFPCDPSTLQISSSLSRTQSGKTHALLAGIPRNHLTLLEQVLRAAKLKPVSFCLPLTVLQPTGGAKDSAGVLALVIGETQVGVQITAGGGIVSLRALEGAIETDGGRRTLNKEFIAREARITLGQLPAELRNSVKSVRIFGPRDLAQQLADELELRFEPMGLSIEVISKYETGAFGVQLPADAAVSGMFSAAAAALVNRPRVLEFLPPRIAAWRQIVTRYSSGRLGLVGAAAGAVALLVIAAFAFQQWQLVRLDAQWTRLAPKVKDLKQLQAQISQYRPWFDQNCRVLTIMRQLTEAFPEDGIVTAKTVEIRDAGIVSCTGQTRDYQALMRILEKLGKSKGITDVRLSMVRGKSPMQFTFDFHWSEGGAL